MARFLVLATERPSRFVSQQHRDRRPRLCPLPVVSIICGALCFLLSSRRSTCSTCMMIDSPRGGPSAERRGLRLKYGLLWFSVCHHIGYNFPYVIKAHLEQGNAPPLSAPPVWMNNTHRFLLQVPATARDTISDIRCSALMRLLSILLTNAISRRPKIYPLRAGTRRAARLLGEVSRRKLAQDEMCVFSNCLSRAGK